MRAKTIGIQFHDGTEGVRLSVTEVRNTGGTSGTFYIDLTRDEAAHICAALADAIAALR